MILINTIAKNKIEIKRYTPGTTYIAIKLLIDNTRDVGLCILGIICFEN